MCGLGSSLVPLKFGALVPLKFGALVPLEFGALVPLEFGALALRVTGMSKVPALCDTLALGA